MPAATSRNKAKNDRSSYRQGILATLTAAGFTLAGEPMKRDESRFFSADLFYPSLFITGSGLRTHIRLEMSLSPPALPPVARPIASLIGMAQQKPPEIQAFLCVDPIETAADKLSALAWRVHARRRGSNADDPTIVRHLHDLASLKDAVIESSNFAALARKAAVGDAGRGGEATASADPATLLASMLEKLSTDKLWVSEYEDYVDAVSFALPAERIGFSQALAAVRDLVERLGADGGTDEMKA
jgi:nucleotidyltransferase AbiEii toxin of type IV toxin-antitoxin system